MYDNIAPVSHDEGSQVHELKKLWKKTFFLK